MTTMTASTAFKAIPLQNTVAKTNRPISLNFASSKGLPKGDHFVRSSPIYFGKESLVEKKMKQLREQVGKLDDLGAAEALGHWDMETRMPSGSGEARGALLTTLSETKHKKLTSKSLGNLIEVLQKKENFQQLSPIDQAIVKEVGRNHTKAKKLPSNFVTEYSKTATEGHEAWVKAREANDFEIFAPSLEKLVALNRQEAKLLGYQEHPYDALLDNFEEGMTVAQLDPIFDALRKEIVPLLKAIVDSPIKPNTNFIGNGKKYGQKSQFRFSEYLLKKMGFDFKRGRMDVAIHPFTTSFGAPLDVRITTRFKPDDLRESIGSTVHEGGHALYEQGVSPKLFRTGLAEGTSMGMHESQSRLWENQVAQSKPFWEHFLPQLKKRFPKQLDGVSVEQFYGVINDVKPSFIRTDADEVTYNLHIMLRYEIEKELIEGRIEVKDLPKIWNKKMEEYLGVTPDSDLNGVLQDVHWSSGSFGYFPTYALGNLYAAQIFNTAKKEMPELESQIETGKLLPLKQWLNKNIHDVGKMETAETIAKRVTGETLNPTYFMDYLWQKYGELYNLKRPSL